MCKISSYVVAATVLVALALCPVAARADSTSFDLTYASTVSGTLASYSPDYAKVTVSLDATQKIATITFTTVGFGNGTYYMGDGGAAVLNVSGTFTAAVNSTATGDPGWDGNTPTTSNGGIGTHVFDGSDMGNFNLFISNKETNSGYDGLVQTLSFTLTNTGGTWADASHVLVLDATDGKFEAASHITVEGVNNNGPCSPSNLCQGYGAGNPVPEPPVNALLACSALLFSGLFLRRPLWF